MRKLLPESWGFLCPVHTPDGSPCGLLNHFTAACRVVAQPSESPADTMQAVIEVPPPPPLLCCVGCFDSPAWSAYACLSCLMLAAPSLRFQQVFGYAVWTYQEKGANQ